jgi:hypothetical protein
MDGNSLLPIMRQILFQFIVLDQTIRTIKKSVEQSDDCKKYTLVQERSKFSY